MVPLATAKAQSPDIQRKGLINLLGRIISELWRTDIVIVAVLQLVVTRMITESPSLRALAVVHQHKARFLNTPY